MAEIVDDLKISNVEITNSLGINLTSDFTRIKHTGNDELNISSSGEINIRTEKKNDSDCDINFYTGNGSDIEGNDNEGGDIRLYTGDGGGNEGSGGDILIIAGDGITAINGGNGGYIQIFAGDGGDEGGFIKMHAGDGVTGNADGGYIEIYAGDGCENGGSIDIRGGDSGVNNPTNSSSAGSVNIYGGDSDGQNASAGSINIASGDCESSGTDGYGGDLYLQAGNSDNGIAGFLGIYGGNGAIYGGGVRIEAGTKYGTNNFSGASVEIYGGAVSDSTGTGTGGSVIIASGKSEDHKYGDIIIGTLDPPQTPTAYGSIYISGDPQQKIGFFGNTPVIRPASTGEVNGVDTPAGGANLRHDSTFTGYLGDKAYTISDIVKALKQLGLLDTYNAAPGVAHAPIDALQARIDKPKKAKQVKIERNKTDKTKETDDE